MNVQGSPVVQSSSLTGNPKTSQSTGVPTAGLQGSSTSSSFGSSPSDAAPTLTTGAATSSHQLSSGAIGGIVVVCLLFLIGFIVLFMRRRSIARRLEQRKQWWFGGNTSSGSFSIVGGGSVRNSQSGEAPILNRASARSSFATNFDQGLMFRIDSPPPLNIDLAALGTIPEFPPMAEVRERTSVLFPSAGAVARRESLNSMMSNGSDPDTQYLVVGNDLNPPGSSSPMSVRPFSPSESFAFPKPPLCPKEGQRTSSVSLISGYGLVSPSSTAASLIQIHSPPPIFNSDLLPSAPAASYPLPPPSGSLTAVPDTSSDPFADPAQPEFETISRPFVPTLDDEVSVAPGDQVLVLKVFDDGWAFVEKQCKFLDHNERGLIPVDCLREAGQALPAFLAQKRVSSYGADSNQLAQTLASSFHAP